MDVVVEEPLSKLRVAAGREKEDDDGVDVAGARGAAATQVLERSVKMMWLVLARGPVGMLDGAVGVTVDNVGDTLAVGRDKAGLCHWLSPRKAPLPPLPRKGG